MEDALWAAIRGFEEKATLSERVAARLPATDQDALDRLKQRGETAKRHAQELRSLIESLPVQD